MRTPLETEGPTCVSTEVGEPGPGGQCTGEGGWGGCLCQGDGGRARDRDSQDMSHERGQEYQGPPTPQEGRMQDPHQERQKDEQKTKG